MHRKSKILTTMFLLTVGMMFARPPTTIEAQQQVPTGQITKQQVSRLETNVDQFENLLLSELKQSKLVGTEREDEIAAYMSELERSTDRLESRLDHGPIAADITRVLGDALRIENFLRRNPLSPTVSSSWERVKTDLNDLAKSRNILWVWTAKNYPPMTDDERRATISRLESRADEFRESFDDALDLSRADGKPFEDHMTAVVATFERSLDDLDGRVGRREQVDEKNVLIVLNNAAAIDEYMQKYRMTPRARLDWASVKAQLDDLARIYNVAWVWTVKPGSTTTTAVDAKKPKEQ